MYMQLRCGWRLPLALVLLGTFGAVAQQHAPDYMHGTGGGYEMDMWGQPAHQAQEAHDQYGGQQGYHGNGYGYGQPQPQHNGYYPHAQNPEQMPNMHQGPMPQYGMYQQPQMQQYQPYPQAQPNGPNGQETSNMRPGKRDKVLGGLRSSCRQVGKAFKNVTGGIRNSKGVVAVKHKVKLRVGSVKSHDLSDAVLMTKLGNLGKGTNQFYSELLGHGNAEQRGLFIEAALSAPSSAAAISRYAYGPFFKTVQEANNTFTTLIQNLQAIAMQSFHSPPGTMDLRVKLAAKSFWTVFNRHIGRLTRAISMEMLRESQQINDAAMYFHATTNTFKQAFGLVLQISTGIPVSASAHKSVRAILHQIITDSLKLDQGLNIACRSPVTYDPIPSASGAAPAPHHGMAGGMDGMQDGAMSGMGSGMTEQHNLDGINEMNGSVGQSEMSGSQLPPQEYGQPGDDYFNQLNESMGNVDNFSW
eukprot:GHVT01027921.1.p1 GENE.GHVT01027921.1~~GHVT01027921.1.p1  ORF type:complete len:472 (-),score=54.49 GHVT01027921.1:785-2200(-)